MEALPLELRLLILRNLDARALSRVSLSCTALRAAASDDSLWRAICAELYPRGANVGTALAPKHRDCVLRANGWAHIPRMPRELISFAPSGRASRSGATLESITAFDADDDLLIVGLSRLAPGPTEMIEIALELFYADGRRKRLTGPTGAASHIELCDEALHGYRALVITDSGACWLLRPDDEEDPLTPFPLTRFGGTEYATHAGDDIILLSAETGLRIDGGRHTGFVLDRFFQLGLKTEARVELTRGAVVDPLEPAITTLGARVGDRSILYRFDWRTPSVSAENFIETHHKNLLRVRAGRDGTVLTSHLFSKDVQTWDWRRLDSHGRSDACVETYRCCGIGPDIDAANGVLACVSRGAPGTSYGAKLHTFGLGGARAAAHAGLSEVVIDSFHRNALSRGVKLCDRTLTVLLDEQRLLRCRIE